MGCRIWVIRVYMAYIIYGTQHAHLKPAPVVAIIGSTKFCQHVQQLQQDSVFGRLEFRVRVSKVSWGQW